MRASFALCEGEAGGGVKGVTLPTERAFILGLSEPTQGEIVGWWSETGTVAVPPSTPYQSSLDFVTQPKTQTRTHIHVEGSVCL